MKTYERTWAEVNVSYLAHNMREIKAHINNDTKIMAIVKADGCGHGSVTASKAFLESGADYLGVASCDEAITLRNAGITVPILLLSYTPPVRYPDVVKYDLMQTIFNPEMVELLSECAQSAGYTAKIHLKIDTGMGRVGFEPTEKSIGAIKNICGMKGLDVWGIFTHFAQSDSFDLSFTVEQFKRFEDFIKMLEQHGIHIPMKHASNSGGVIAGKQFNMNIVRPGLMLYGLPPSAEVDLSGWNLKRALSWKTQISFVKPLDENISVGYGRNYYTKQKSVIATIPVGYADGFKRILSNKGRVLVNGRFAPVVGNVCMDQSMIDVTGIDDVQQGDEVVLIGSQNGNEITADEIAITASTINYEIVTTIGKRVPRVYV